MGAHAGGCRATLLAALGYGWMVACGGSSTDPEGAGGNGGDEATGGGGATGGATSSGGSTASVGGSAPSTGGVVASGGTASNGGTPSTGGATGGAGNVSTGGTAAGGTAAGGAPVIHRPAAVQCANHIPPFSPGSGEPRSNGVCDIDADCVEKPYGHCVAAEPPPLKWCAYGCVRDADCEEGFVCECEEPVGRCVQGACAVDAECPEGELCVLSSSPGVCGGPPAKSYACGVRPVDGTGGSNVGGCGRPFLVGGAARRAEPEPRSDYEDALGPDVVTLAAVDRAALAAHWTDVGLMEHASVAAFARFTLQLLSLGAPSDLVQASNAALADELVHARLAFGLASAYGAGPVGPGPLAVEHSLGGTDFVDLVRTTFLEACVGETCAAVEASDARDAARDPAVKAALARIAGDELRHAALGYRFVQWALRASAPDLRRDLRAMLARELVELHAASAAIVDIDVTPLTEHGLLPGRARAASRALAVRDVVVPAVRALLQETGRSAVAPAANALA